MTVHTASVNYATTKILEKKHPGIHMFLPFILQSPEYINRCKILSFRDHHPTDYNGEMWPKKQLNSMHGIGLFLGHISAQ